MGLVAPWHVGSSRTRAWTRVPYIGRRILNHWTTREVPMNFLSIHNAPTALALSLFYLFKEIHYSFFIQTLCYKSRRHIVCHALNWIPEATLTLCSSRLTGCPFWVSFVTQKLVPFLCSVPRILSSLNSLTKPWSNLVSGTEKQSWYSRLPKINSGITYPTAYLTAGI